MKAKSVFCLLGISIGAATAQASPSACYDIPGYTLCSLDPQVMFNTMTVIKDVKDDDYVGGNWRVGYLNGMADTWTCIEGIAYGLPHYYSCRYNESLAKGKDAIGLYEQFIASSASEVVMEQQRFLTYNPFGLDPEMPLGSRMKGEQKLGDYACWVEVNYDDLNYSQVNWATSRGDCRVELVKKL